MKPLPPDITKLRADPIPPMPENVEVEQRLLGAVLTSNAEFRRVAGIVQPEDFAYAAHQRIFGAIEKLLQTGIEANPVTLAPYVETDEALREVGGARYLVKLVRCAVSVTAAVDYAYLVVDLAIRRRLGSDLFNPEPGKDCLDVLGEHRDRMDCLRRAKSRIGVGGDVP
jgi:replicative DNA helicase